MVGIIQNSERTEEKIESQRGHLLPTLLSTDLGLTGRWDYLTDCWESGTLPDAGVYPSKQGRGWGQ